MTTSGSGLGVLQRIQEVLEGHQKTTKRIPHPRSKRFLLNLDACTGCDWTSEEDGQHTTHQAALVQAIFNEEMDVHRKFVAALIADTDWHPSGVCPVCSYLWSECTCGVTERDL